MQPNTSVPLLLALGPTQQRSSSSSNQRQPKEESLGENEKNQQQEENFNSRFISVDLVPNNHNKLKKSKKTKQSNRSLHQSVVRRAAGSGSSKLIENFQEFLASRNVINRCSRYDKIVNDPSPAASSSKSDRRDRPLLRQSDEFVSPQSPIEFRNTATDNEQRQPVFRYNSSDQLSTSTTTSRGLQENKRIYNDYFLSGSGYRSKPNNNGRVLLLMGALLSRNQRNKASVLVKLLRAPIVLAALFSLILVATLLTLYTISFFHHNNMILTKIHTSSSIVHESTYHETLTTTTAQHHINSRHLQKTPASWPSTGNGFDSDNNNNNNEEDEFDSFPYDSSSAVVAAAAAAGDSGNKLLLLNLTNESGFDRALTVQTECGSFVGQPEQEAILFSGIPYATPPINERRWKRPKPVWLDEQLCKRNKTIRLSLKNNGRGRNNHCAQLSPVTRRFSGHEDCLYLDIYAPKLDQVQKLPVMVYIHGGFLAFGSSGQGQVNWMKARPNGRLAAELNVVLVAFNYRLQALGFMTLLQLAQNNGPDGSEGNYGLWDQLVALNWIKRNIESFGGDPDNIILFGPDSASSLPLALLTKSTTGQSFTSHSNITPSSQKGSIITTNNQHHHHHHHLSNSNSNSNSDSDSNSNSDGKTTTTTTNLHESKKSKMIHDSRDLFRAVWLTNPTVYYENPYEQANRHYQRLFLDQSPCSEWSRQVVATSATASTAAASASANNNNNNSAPSNRTNLRNKSKFLDQDQRKQQSKLMLIECLMNLTAEQVLRHYLGQDDPSYRLDDQNSLPIHGVFADQFVTIDRELVQSFYPFIPPSPMPQDTINSIQQEDGASYNLNSLPSKSHQNSLDPTKSRETVGNHSSHYQRSSNISSSGSWQPTVKANESQADKLSYNDDYDDDNCIEGKAICASTSTRNAQEEEEEEGRSQQMGIGKDLLLGSTAQAVEYWPCPRDLHQWTWLEFRRYVNISLNSFIPDTYKKASELYNVPIADGSGTVEAVATTLGEVNGINISSNNSNNNNNKRRSSKQEEEDEEQTIISSPIKTYLTMVSDIRQVCPINELAESLSSPGANSNIAGKSRWWPHKVHRYIVETTPTGKRVSSGHNNNNNNNLTLEQQQEQHRNIPNYAFHTWDLMAFFGFEFDWPYYEPSKEDLKFQFQIREMVRRFVHRTTPKGENDDDDENSSPKAVKDDRSSQGNKYTLFGRNSVKTMAQNKHKIEECRMWRRHLGQLYAWVS